MSCGDYVVKRATLFLNSRKKIMERVRYDQIGTKMGNYIVVETCGQIIGRINTPHLDHQYELHKCARFMVDHYRKINNISCRDFSVAMTLALTIINIRKYILDKNKKERPLIKFADVIEKVTAWTSNLRSNNDYNVLGDIIDTICVQFFEPEVIKEFGNLSFEGFSLRLLSIVTELLYIYYSQYFACQQRLKDEPSPIHVSIKEIAENFKKYFMEREFVFRVNIIQFTSSRGFSEYLTRLYAILRDKPLSNCEKSYDTSIAASKELMASDTKLILDYVNNTKLDYPSQLPLHFFNLLVLYTLDHWFNCVCSAPGWYKKFVISLPEYIGLNDTTVRGFPVICQTTWFTYDTRYCNMVYRSESGGEEMIFEALLVWFELMKKYRDGKINKYTIPDLFS